MNCKKTAIAGWDNTRCYCKMFYNTEWSNYKYFIVYHGGLLKREGFVFIKYE